MTEKQANTLIVGASVAGLASAACLQKRNIGYIIIERQDQVGAPWRNHYARLHLHTNKRISNLPYKKFGRALPRYPNREQVVEYLESYQRAFNINPLFNTEALSIKKVNGHWLTETNNGVFKTKFLVMATGAYSRPKAMVITGMETFPGPIIHSYGYKSGIDFKGRQVLVVGFGNSACEIAIDLYEQGAAPSMAVRSPVNVIPRDLLGVPVLELSLLLSKLSPWLADRISAPLLNMVVGNISKLGLKKKPYGPLEQIYREGNAPVLDIGTIEHIRKGHIKIFNDIMHIVGKAVHFKSGDWKNFDAIIAAIGYYRDYAEIVKVDSSRFEDLKLPTARQKYFGKDGLYFCGYWVSPTGQIREISLDARRIAKHMQRHKA